MISIRQSIVLYFCIPVLRDCLMHGYAFIPVPFHSQY